MKTTVLIIMFLTILSQIFGFGRELVLAYFYGTSNISDVYLISLTITSVLFGFLGKGISTGYIPLYTEIEHNKGSEEAFKFTNTLSNIMIIFCTIVIILSYIFIEPIVKIFASGFNKEAFTLAVKFTRISLVSIYFTGLINIFSGFLKIKGSFIVTAAISLPMNIVIIISIYLSSKTNVEILAVGFVFATFIQFIILILFSYKKKYKYSLNINVKDENIKKISLIAIPVIIGTSVNQINLVVDRTIASQISVGGISALNYANVLNDFVLAVFVTSISTVMFPMVSKMVTNNNMKELKKVLSKVIVMIIMLIIPATVGFMVFAQPIVEMLYGRGAFDDSAVLVTSNALFFYSIGLIGFALRNIISSVFYSLQNTKTPMINATIAMVLNVILNIILSKYIGIGGLALATSISAIVAAILLMLNLRKKIGPFNLKNIIPSIVKIFIASILMGVTVNYLYYLLLKDYNPNASLIVSIIVGIILYIAIVFIFKVREANDFLKQVLNKSKKFTSRKS